MFILFAATVLTLTLGEVFTIQLPTNTTIQQFERRHRLRHIQHVLGYDVFQKTNETRRRSLRSVEGLVRSIPRKQFKRDPLYSMQWHLHGSKYGVETIPSKSGSGVNIAIVDDGLEHTHPDLSQNYRPALSWDFNDNDADPTPNYNDGHGTCCAGVVAAASNNVCGRGVAYQAGIAGIKILGKAAYDYQEAQALSHKSDKIRLYSCSWGPTGINLFIILFFFLK